MSESATTVSIRNNLEKTHCLTHRSERIQFYCACKSINICALCVPAHSSHELVVLKDKCAQLIRPWISMKNLLTRTKNRINTYKDLVPESEYDVLIERTHKFDNLYNKMTKLKEQFQVKDIEDINAQYYEKYRDKVYHYAKQISKKYLPKEKLARKLPNEESKYSGEHSEVILIESSENSSEDRTLAAFERSQAANKSDFEGASLCGQKRKLSKESIQQLEERDQDLLRLKEMYYRDVTSLKDRADKLEQICIQLHKEQIKIREQNEELLRIVSSKKRDKKHSDKAYESYNDYIVQLKSGSSQSNSLSSSSQQSSSQSEMEKSKNSSINSIHSSQSEHEINNEQTVIVPKRQILTSDSQPSCHSKVFSSSESDL